MKDGLAYVGIRAGDCVLDVGFRDVAELEALAAAVGPAGSVVGIDSSPGRIVAAKQQLVGRPGSRIVVLRASALDLPFADGAFDVVFCKGVLHEIRRIERALEEIARICKAGGCLCIVDATRFSRIRFEAYRVSSWLRGRRTGDAHPGFSHDRLRRRLAEAGFDEQTYEVLPSTWRLGFNRVRPFLLRSRRASAP